MMRPLPVLVSALLACSVPWSLWPRCTASMVTDVEHPEPSFASRMELFKHVLLNDDPWWLVLKEHIRVDKVRVRYEFTENNEQVLNNHFQLVEEGLNETTALAVIQKLMVKCPFSGTCVNYAASVLSTAFTCYTYNNMSFVLSRVIRVDTTARNQNKVDSESVKLDEMLDDVRMTLTVFMDKMAVVDGDLKVLSAGLYDYDSADEEGSDIVQINVLEALLAEVKEKLAEECSMTPEEKMIENMKQCYTANTNDHSWTDALTDFNNLVNCVIQIYDLFNVQMMPMETWIRVLDYRVPIRKNINLFMDDNAFERTRENSMSKRLKAAILKSNVEETKKEKEDKKQKKIERKAQKLLKKQELKPKEAQSSKPPEDTAKTQG